MTRTALCTLLSVACSTLIGAFSSAYAQVPTPSKLPDPSKEEAKSRPSVRVSCAKGQEFTFCIKPSAESWVEAGHSFPVAREKDADDISLSKIDGPEKHNAAYDIVIRTRNGWLHNNQLKLRECLEKPTEYDIELKRLDPDGKTGNSIALPARLIVDRDGNAELAFPPHEKTRHADLKSADEPAPPVKIRFTDAKSPLSSSEVDWLKSR
jgi:hypothetical protein